jgi:aldose 1-epimerase
MTIFSLHNARGMRVAINAHDASVHSWWAPDRYGRMADVLAATAPLAPVLTGWQGGMSGEGSLLLHLAHEGLSARLLYRLGDDGSLHLDCEVTVPADSLFLLPAPRFNLQGRSSSVADHVLRLAASRCRPAGRPHEEPADVAGSAFDFRQPAPVGARLAWPALAGMAGFDHVFYAGENGGQRVAALVAEPASGRVLRFSSTQAGFHLRSDAGGFSCAMQALEMPPGASARLALIYRLGVQDMDVFDISEPVSMPLNK